ncbi:MAG: hypothetical protein A2Z17_00730 [Gammaproteobacteria bacterium RBG_16_66_13]|nr:MAG: hypothetical protein A2Z17_00730 [Gammaproteobacteria bacterium RBG_16_66_13]
MTAPRRRLLRSLILLLALINVALLGTYALKKATPYGLGLVNDTAAYVAGAEGFLEGRGYSRLSGGGEIRPITHFPPFYSAVLAAFGWAGIDMLLAARIIALALFAATIVLAGLLAYQLTASAWLAVLASGLVAASDGLLGVYALALSESLFLVLLLVTFLLVSRSSLEARGLWLGLAGICIALACLTRYTGVALLAAAVLAIVVPPNDPRARWRATAALTLPTIVFVGAWLTRNILVAGTATNRVAVWHPVSFEATAAGIRNVAGWAMADGLLAARPAYPVLLDILAWGSLCALILWLALTRGGNRVTSPGRASGHVLAWFVLVYTTFLLLSKSLFDASTPLDFRLFSPVALTMMILTGTALRWLWDSGRLAARLVAASLAGFLLLTSIQDASATVERLEVDGQGFAALGWQHSPAVQAIRDLPEDRWLYSDRPTAIALLTDRTSYIAPSPVDPATGVARAAYDDDLNNMRERILQGEAVLALFKEGEGTDPETLAWLRDLTEGMPILAEFNDATLYGKP